MPDADRHPRVQLTYDVDTDDGTERRELPFVVGVLADLSGKPAAPPKPLRERVFVGVDRETFDDVLAKAAPRLALKVANEVAGDGSEVAVELTFRSLADFEPGRVVEQVPPLAELLRARRQLARLRDKLAEHPALAERLSELLADPERARQLARDLGAAP